jgi:hypothetical protein
MYMCTLTHVERGSVLNQAHWGFRTSKDKGFEANVKRRGGGPPAGWGRFAKAGRPEQS